MDEDAVFEFHNVFLRWWPKVLLALAVLVLFLGWRHTEQWTTLLVVIAFVHGRWLPWKFTISGDGLLLRFPFGRRLFLPRTVLTVRLEIVGAIAMIGRHRRFGYLLMERFGYSPEGEDRMRGAFSGLGYNLL